MGGQPLALAGREPQIGQPAPEFEVVDSDLAPVRLSDLRGKVCLLLSVTSLDTSVCDTEIRKFNEEATALGPDVVVLTVSMDLPFGQSRWCGAAGVDKVATLSDHRDAAFGEAFGMLIKELRLLARAVFVVDQDGVIQYIQLVKEVTQEPDYDAVLAAVKQLV
jgi:thiol peroxidase